MLKKTSLNISGMHCVGCKNLIESEMSALDGVKSISVDHKKDNATVEYDEEKIDIAKIIPEIEKLNYKVIHEKNETRYEINETKDTKETKNSLGYLILFIAFVMFGYFAINYFGGFELLSKLNEGHVAYSLLFIIGVLAGFHCVGMCGGLVLTYSTANVEEEKKKSLAPHFQYNLGRIISYTIIGGILGGIGSFFGINPFFTGTVLIIASIFMILMGLSFLTDFKILKKIKLNTPAFIAKFLYANKKNKKPKGPFIIGLLTGFMPCGPLQAMQLYALTQGSITRGALSMAVYALGTTFILFAFGAVINSIKTQNITKMLKFSGAFIIILGIMMANRGLANFGFNFMPTPKTESQTITDTNKEEFQEIRMNLTYSGYEPNTLYIKSGIPVRWIINVKQMTGCTDAIMIESLGIKRDLKLGENIIEFTPPANVKEIKFSCWMRMVWGKFIVSDNGKISTKSNNNIKTNVQENENTGTCNAVCSASGCGCGK